VIQRELLWLSRLLSFSVTHRGTNRPPLLPHAGIYGVPLSVDLYQDATRRWRREASRRRLHRSSGDSQPVICCPKRLYAEEYRILRDVADAVFGPDAPMIAGNQVNVDRKAGNRVFAFGSALGGEIKLPTIGGRGGFFVDWILALVDRGGELKEFVAVEVQSIDTTGNYRKERDAYVAEKDFAGYSKAGINWRTSTNGSFRS